MHAALLTVAMQPARSVRHTFYAFAAKKEKLTLRLHSVCSDLQLLLGKRQPDIIRHAAAARADRNACVCSERHRGCLRTWRWAAAVPVTIRRQQLDVCKQDGWCVIAAVCCACGALAASDATEPSLLAAPAAYAAGTAVSQVSASALAVQSTWNQTTGQAVRP